MKRERKAYRKAYNAAHKEERKKYYETHKTEMKEYYETHKEERKEYNETHKTERNAYNKFHQKQKYCCEDISQIENYELAKKDNFISWDIHHRLETNNSDGERRLVDLTTDELKVLDMYYNRPASELIFMKHSEHLSLHRGKKNENKKDKLQSME